MGIDVETLKNSSWFADLPEAHLMRIMENAEKIELEANEVLMAEGSLPDAFYVVLDGEFEIIKHTNDRDVVVSVSKSGEILGEFSVIENVPRMFTVRAVRPSVVMKINLELFNELVTSSPAIALTLLRTVMRRVRVSDSMLGQQERLASLGTLAAGLAHELNNPAAAARRSAILLQQAIVDWLQSRSEMDMLRLEPNDIEFVVSRLRQDVGHDTHPLEAGDPLERSDREEEIEGWLEAQNIEKVWEIAPNLAAFGWEAKSLEEWCQKFDASQLPVILAWLSAGYNVHNLLDEIYTSTERISEIIGAVKRYSYLDQAPQKEIDVHEGLENTLIILRHKIKQGVRIQRDYDKSLPRIEAYAGELNQVWTNLMDNAIDAMNGSGELRLRTYLEKKQVVVEIGDNGPGISEAVQGRIFEPFFTTKPPGSGTGLGLYISHSIVQKHHGRLEVYSKPGDTRFKVTLPVRGV